MKRSIYKFGIVSVAFSYFMASVALANPPQFSAQSLEKLGIEGTPLRINDNGQILFTRDRLGFLYTPEFGVRLIPTPDPNATDVHHPIRLTFDDLNNKGEVAVSVAEFSGSFLLSQRAFIYSDSTGLQDVAELLNSDREIFRLFAINDVGDIFGSKIITQSIGGIDETESFLFTEQDGFILPDDPELRPVDMNNQREAVGDGFWYSPSEGEIDTEDFFGRRINNLGQAVGIISQRLMPSSAAIYTPSDGARFLPTLTGERDNSVASGLNDQGWVIGLGKPLSNQVGFVPTLIIGDEIWELNSLVNELDPDEFLSVFEGIDINNKGEIIAEGLDRDGQRGKYVLLTPKTDDIQYYRFRAAHSGKFLDVKGASTRDGAKVVQWRWYDGDNQKWLIESEAGVSRLVAKHSGLCLSLDVRKKRRASHIRQRKCSDDDSQRWRLTEDKRGFELRSLLNEQCIGIKRGHRRNGAKAVGWHCHGRANQRFVIDRL